MRIVLQTSVYWPRRGGVETVAQLLAEEFTSCGHAVTVVTDTPGPGAEPADVPVLRQAPMGRRLAALRSADVVLMFGMSLRFLPSPVALRRPTVVSHHTWYDAGFAAPLKRLASRFTRNIAASAALAKALGAPATVIPNPYDDHVFFNRGEVQRGRDLVFVGRLVSDKGLSVLIEALAVLARGGNRPTLTVIGAGPEEPPMRAAASAAGIEPQVEWAGSLAGEELAIAIGRHRVLVVPSRWNEPFGVVALEGAACGCAVVGSSGGGLPEAIGPAGATFANGDARALADALRQALARPQARPQPAIEEHLRRHSRRVVAQRYLEVLADAAR